MTYKCATQYLRISEETMNTRGETYDGSDEERSMELIVDIFNKLTGRTLSEQEGWLFMCCLKMVRQFAKEGHHEDSSIDLVSYAALMAESFSKNNP